MNSVLGVCGAYVRIPHVMLGQNFARYKTMNKTIKESVKQLIASPDGPSKVADAFKGPLRIDPDKALAQLKEIKLISTSDQYRTLLRHVIGDLHEFYAKTRAGLEDLIIRIPSKI